MAREIPETTIWLRAFTPESLAKALESPVLSGARMYGAGGLPLPREPWPAPIHAVHTSDEHVLKGLSEFELEEAFAENWESWD